MSRSPLKTSADWGQMKELLDWAISSRDVVTPHLNGIEGVSEIRYEIVVL